MAGAADGDAALMLDGLPACLSGTGTGRGVSGAGGVTALFGPSGCGKTTTVNAVAGLVRPDSGRIAVGGRVLFDAGADLPPQARRIGYVFRTHGFFRI